MSSDTSTWRERVAQASSTFIPGTPAERVLLLLLLLLASLLRCWNLPHIPFTHDEISALVRVNYATLGEAINKGVVNIDTHPPGVHAFTWLWTRLFGFGEGIVKLPFIIASICAIFLLYRFAYAWTGGPTALVCTAVFASTQYMVMYGQIARPYAMGLFTTALMADQLTRYMGSGSRRSLIMFGLAAVLSAYTHHFTLMLTAFIYLTGLLLVEGTKRKAYLILGGIAALMYAPNLPLFFAQLGWKGLDEWLLAPGSDWLPNYAWWIAHCSVLFAVVLGLLLVVAAGSRIAHRASSAPLWMITLVWGVLPLAIGYGYSLWRSPVLQYSVVIFSFPYMLIGALAGLRHLKPWHGIALGAMTSVVSVFTLISERHHYTIFYNSIYETIAHGMVDATKHGDRIALVDTQDHMLQFYLHHWGIDSAAVPYLELRGSTQYFIDSALRVNASKRVFYGQTTDASPENVAVIQRLVPFLVERHDLYEGQTFVFEPTPHGPRIDDIGKRIMITPQAIDGEGWTVDKDVPLITDSAASYIVPPKRWDFTGHEFGAVFGSPVYELVRSDNDVLELRADLEHVDPLSDLALVVELKEGDSTRFYRSSSMIDQRASASPHHALIVALKLSDIPGHGQAQQLRAYIWNKGKRAAWISALSVQVRDGDPVLYGFYQPITDEWKYR